ncbi:ComEC/Rec2 family competence protein [Rhizobium paknamense]|uniref:ComEC/Rec2-related protein n=1 Tax=Rhizobium paknamense TaxID=1206817 RepID=A0ABU0IFE0_9HYPH|nr:ComEC/Rec2 family competence protein [Rhizobium paknamense]MDQ0455934.1 ComEC/Rec2-related protein [Rhizobium paknamense]
MPENGEWALLEPDEAPQKRRRLRAMAFRVPVATEEDGEWQAEDLAAARAEALGEKSYIRRVHRNVGDLLREERDHGRAFLAAPVLIGTGAALWFSLHDDPSFWGLFAAFSGAFALWLALRHRAELLSALAAAGALILAGMILAEAETARQATVLLDTPVTTMIRGRVVSVEPNKDGHQRYVIALQDTREPRLTRMPQQVALLARSRHEPFRPGDGLEGRARLSPPSGPALPGLNDFAFASYYAGTGAIGYFYSAPRPVDLAPGEAGWMERLSLAMDLFTEDLRDTISNRIRSLIAGDAGAFAVAIVTGERRGLSDAASDALRVSGLAHIISISGLHMALAGGLCFVGLRRGFSLVPGLAESLPIKKIAAGGALLTTTAYFLISGYDVAAQRSYLMMVILLSAALFDRPVLSLRNTALAALIVITLSPSQVLGPSLQMSFAATFALIAGFDLWRRRPHMPEWLEGLPLFSLVKPLAKAVAASLMTSALGGFSTAIFSAAHFHRFGLHGLEANLLAAPIISMLVMPAGLIGMLLMPFGLDVWPIRLMGFGLDLVLSVAHLVSGWGKGLSFGLFDWWFLPVSTAGLLLLMLLKTRLRLWGLVLIAAAISHEAFRPQQPVPDLLVAEDGRLVAWLDPQVTGELLAVSNRRTPPSFVFNQWSTAFDISHVGRPVMVGKAPKPDDKTALAPEETRRAMQEVVDAARANPVVFYCRPSAFCALAAKGWTVVTVERRDYLESACQAADLVIASVSKRRTGCEAGKPAIDLDGLRAAGAMEITLGDAAAQTYTARTAFSGENRPWTRHRYYDWRSRSFNLPVDDDEEGDEQP